MLLFLLILVAAIGLTVISIAFEADDAFSLAFIIWIVVIVMTILAVSENCSPEAELARLQQEQEILQYQVDNDFYSNDLDYGKSELYKEVKDWNKNIAFVREVQDSIWIGMFYADIYDQVELIKLS